MRLRRHRAIYWSQIGVKKSIKHSSFKFLKYLYKNRKQKEIQQNNPFNRKREKYAKKQ